MPPSAGAARFPARLWEEVLRRGRHAVVFMDDPCAESLHWSGGVSRLLEAGARNVKQLSSFEAGAEDEPRALFVVSTLLKGRTADVIKDVVSLSRFRCCVVVTAMPHSLHLLAGGVTAELEGSPVFQQFEERLREWMGDASCTAEVVHVPVVFAQLSPQLLLVPSFADLFPLLETDLRSIDGNRPEKRRHGRPMDVDVHALPLALQVKVKALASALNALFELSGTREESFAVGPMSRMIAGELASQAKAGRKAAVHKASVVFIDRTLDLTGAVGHHGDNLVEKILSVLPQLPGHVTDVQVDMVGLTQLQHTPTVQGTLAPGCLAQNQSATARLLWETMLVAKQKEAVMEVRRHLVEAASKENLPFKINLGRVTSEQLSSYAQLFRGSWGALQSHCGVLQLGLATAQTLRPAGLARWDACLAFEKLLLQGISGSAACSCVVTMHARFGRSWIRTLGPGPDAIDPRSRARLGLLSAPMESNRESRGSGVQQVPSPDLVFCVPVGKGGSALGLLCSPSFTAVIVWFVDSDSTGCDNVPLIREGRALGDSGLADVLKQLLTIVKSSGSGSGAGGGDDELNVDDLLVLLVYVYSLGQETHVGRSHAEEQVEEELIGALTRSLTNQTTLSQLLQDITGVSTPEELTVERAHTALERVFETLRTLGRSRSQLRQFRSVYNAGDTTHQATYRPFLKQVLEEIFRPGRPECPDIEHTSGGLTDLLKTGISMFMKVSRPHPSDHPLLFLFLVGGVTPSELRLIREVVSAHKAGTQSYTARHVPKVQFHKLQGIMAAQVACLKAKVHKSEVANSAATCYFGNGNRVLGGQRSAAVIRIPPADAHLSSGPGWNRQLQDQPGGGGVCPGPSLPPAHPHTDVTVRTLAESTCLKRLFRSCMLGDLGLGIRGDLLFSGPAVAAGCGDSTQDGRCSASSLHSL
ncbi:hypothetical protein P4O66_008931 [Electrophorus voltai]|uniref:Sec1 family domain containing 2 n=1 Tax=Electrophorus voltai TaxID=2609070 RepID=A0AAD8ZDX4_9TELE|nr:hypothetical protein P4O66_008931 [Electrophorus voltai]